MASRSDPIPGNITPAKVPVLLLKTKSSPSDSYEEILSASQPLTGSFARRYDPRFVPVLLHQFDQGGLQRIRALVQANDISSKPNSKYGGLIFTSQRAVEAFTTVVNGEKDLLTAHYLFPHAHVLSKPGSTFIIRANTPCGLD
jgi:uroporphyrinogen-III synthase